MNILLVTSAAPLMSPFFTNEKRPPLGIGFLISVLRDAGHHVFFIDNYLSPGNFLEHDYLTENKIDLVGIYANTICYRDTKRMVNTIQMLREKGDWKGRIIVGGPHTSAVPESIPELVDHIVIGEGERAILDIVDGVSDRVIQKDLIADLDQLPMPAYDYFVDLPYDFGVEWFPQKPVFTMNTSRGCPFRCTFCSVASVWGREYRYFSADRVADDIRHLVNNYGAKGIYFREDNFTASRKRTVSFCEGLLRHRIDIKWMCETRVDSLDQELMALMHRAGCEALYIGVESGSQRLLDFMKKGITLEQTHNVFRWCGEMGIKTAASFIVGVPTETPAERRMTVELCHAIRPTTCSFNVFVGIPRSPLYDYVLENDLHEYVDDRGLVYLKGHDELVDEFYGGKPATKIPTYHQHARALVAVGGNRRLAFTMLLRAMLENPLQEGLWKSFAMSLLNRRTANVLRRLKRGLTRADAHEAT